VGKKVGITTPGSGTEALLIYLFRKYGYNSQRDVTEVSLGNVNPAAGAAALSSGRVDAVAFPVPTGQVAQVQGVGDIFISPDRGDVPEMVGQVHGVIYAKQQVIDAKPKAVQAFIRAIAQAEAFIYQHPDQAETLMGKYLNLKPQVTKAIFAATKPIYPSTPQISQQGYDAANQFHVKAGLIAIALGYNDLVATDTINAALKGM
jgi:ABC-type nitrate/sulfonate/bicarbonate transport system substrate-binding protein